MVDDRVQRYGWIKAMPASVWLAIYHDKGVSLLPNHVLERLKVDVQQFDHGEVLGSADQAVSNQAGRLVQTRFDQVGQPHHAAEAVRVGVDVGRESDGL